MEYAILVLLWLYDVQIISDKAMHWPYLVCPT